MKVLSILGSDRTENERLASDLVKVLSAYNVGILTNERMRDDPVQHIRPGAMAHVSFVSGMTTMAVRGVDIERSVQRLMREGVDIALLIGIAMAGTAAICIDDYPGENVVARIPAGTGPEGLVHIIEALPERVDLDILIRRVMANPEVARAGAIGTFTGVVRRRSGNEVTEVLEFEACDEIARERIRAIIDDLKRREGIMDVAMHHKTGRVCAGDGIVYIVVAAEHRHQLFPALSDAIERLKAEVPIWKKEFTLEGSYWVHDR